MESKRLMTIWFGSLAFIVLAVSLHRSHGPGEVDHGRIDLTPIHGTLLGGSQAIALPTKIAVVGSFLVVLDIGSDSAMHVVDRTSGELVRSVGRRGSGPGEFEGAWSIDPAVDGENGFWVFDLNLKRSTFIDLEAERSPRSATSADYVNFANEATLTGPVMNARGQWMSLGLFDDGRLGVFNADGQRTAMLGDVPAGPKGMQVISRQQIRQSTLVPHPNRMQFAALPRYASDLELIGLDGQTRFVQGPVQIQTGKFVHGPTRSGPTRRKDARLGYVDGTASRDHIFALFSGRTRGEFGQAAPFAMFVHVFDWDGTFIRGYKLEDPTLAIAVDEAGETLYAVRHDPYPSFLAYDLSVTSAPLGTQEMASR